MVDIISEQLRGILYYMGQYILRTRKGSGSNIM